MKASSAQEWRKNAKRLYSDTFLKQFPDSFVLPQYDGLSIANIPASIGQLLGITEGWSNPCLDADIFDTLPERVERLVLMVVDGLPWQKLVQQLDENDADFHVLFEKHGLIAKPITSVAPSTTSVATTVLTGNGATAAETGMMGYKYLMAEQGLVANMLFWKPEGDAKAQAGTLESWGIKPESYLTNSSSMQILKQAHINTRVIMPALYTKSPLSRMQMREAELDGFMNSTDMWLKLQSWLKETRGHKAYSYVYYPDFDSLSHRDSHESHLWSHLWEEFCFQLQRFYRQLRHAENTLLIITADHGHIHTPLSNRYYLNKHKALLDMCVLNAGGEPRQTYLYVRHGAKDEVLDYAKTYLANSFVALDAKEALEEGLYGNTTNLHSESSRRLGDVILLAKGKNYLWDGVKDKVMLGKHGGLELEEMLVPFIAMSMDN